MKILTDNNKQKLSSKYSASEDLQNTSRGANINVLLNRVKLDRKKEIRKKLYFSAAASTSLILFGLVIFN